VYIAEKKPTMWKSENLITLMNFYICPDITDNARKKENAKYED